MAKAKVKIPKEVAGVKVPKGLRKEAKRALQLADSAAVRELAVSGLAIAAQAFLDKAQSKRAAAATVDQGRRQATAALKANLDALHLGDVLRAAAVEGARRFLEGFDEGQREAPAAKPAPRARAAPVAKPARTKAAPAKPRATAKAAPAKPRAKAKPAPAKRKPTARPGASA